MAFKLRSGNRIPFKLMGSPMKNLLDAANNLVEQTNEVSDASEEMSSEEAMLRLKSRVGNLEQKLGIEQSGTEPWKKGFGIKNPNEQAIEKGKVRMSWDGFGNRIV